ATIGVWCLSAASFVLLLIRRRRWSMLRLLLFAGFSHLAWKATRNSNIFALASGFVACENLSDAVAPESRAMPARSGLHREWCVAGVLVAVILGVVTGFWNQIADKNKPFGLGEARDWFIHEAAKFA